MSNISEANYNNIKEQSLIVENKEGLYRHKSREYIYIDDSGDAGIKGSNTENLIIAAIVIKNEECKALLTEAIDSYRHNIGWNELDEFKFAKTRKELIVGLINSILNFDFKSYIVVLDKKTVDLSKLPKDPLPIYKNVLDELLNKIGNTNQIITIDGKFSKKYGMKIRVSLRQSLRSKGVVDTKIRFVDSRKDSLIQLADIIAGSVARSYKDKSDAELYKKLLSDKIIKIEKIVL